MSNAESGFTLKYVIHAPAAVVFQAWITPRLLQRWGPERAVVDARVGGSFRFETQAGEDPSEKHVVTGEYQELLPSERIVKSWIYEGPMHPGERIETKLTVVFQELDKRAVELTLTEEGPSLSDPEARAGASEAWMEALKMLEIICSAKS